MFEDILSRPSVNFPISLITYLLVFSEALVLGLLISFIFKKRNLSQDQTFQYSLWLIAPIVATLLLFIGSNLALSIGMVGSLSVIRFRTAIKSPLDLMYVFILIMIGLGCGTQNYAITALAATFMGIILYVLGGQKPSTTEETLLILKDSQSSKVEDALTYISGQFPKSKVNHLFLGEENADASITVPEASEGWVLELRKKYPLQSIHLIKK